MKLNINKHIQAYLKKLKQSKLLVHNFSFIQKLITFILANFTAKF